MPDIFYLFSKWRKPILALFIISVVAAGVTAFLLPKRYLSTTTSLPASSYSTDRSRIFNQNIQSLYSDLGTTDELDRIIGTAKLDTVYLAVTDQFNLYDHYKISKSKISPRLCAAILLKKHCRVIKSEYGELKVKVWDTDKNLAPQLANAITMTLDAIHRDLQSAMNKAALKGLQLNRQRIQARIDSINGMATVQQAEDIKMSRRTALNLQLQENEKLSGEYELMLDNKPPVLIVVENAKPANSPDKPRKLMIIASAALLSLIFGLLLAMVLERRKPDPIEQILT